MIQLRIKSESDLYNPYDPSRTRISDGVYHYLKSFCSELEYQKHMQDTLQVITDEPIDEENFRTAFLDAVRDDLNEFDRQITVNNRRMIWEYIVGFGLSFLGVWLSLVSDQILMAIISFLGTTAITNAVSIQTTVNHDIKQQKLCLETLTDLRTEVIRAGEEASLKI